MTTRTVFLVTANVPLALFFCWSLTYQLTRCTFLHIFYRSNSHFGRGFGQLRVDAKALEFWIFEVLGNGAN
jgi:hypothetical protein